MNMNTYRATVWMRPLNAPDDSTMHRRIIESQAPTVDDFKVIIAGSFDRDYDVSFGPVSEKTA